ncbi:MAG: LysM peptidoglycan-binding domain-containing protein [Bacteroidales bacterium]|nr:LysM peptidoglycan-binding domain-containing protein [Bacteroidales bacterium]
MRFTLLIIFTLFIKLIYCQQPQFIEKSDIIVTKNNKKYYKHTVKKGETLYSIARAYQVSVDDIAYENPFVFNGIKTNDTLLIPISSIKVEYIEYEIKKGETLYSIAKKHGVGIEEIIQANPQVTRGLKTGDKIRIPKRELASYDYPEKKPLQNNYDSQLFEENDTTFYVVKKGETVYRICKNFNLTEEEFYKLNPLIKNEGLKANQKVIVFIKKKSSNEVKDTTKHKKALVLFPKGDTSNIAYLKNVNCIEANKKDITLTINENFKEYYVKLNEDLNIINVDNIKTNYSYLEFFEGLIIACDSLKRKGFNIKVNISDNINAATESDVIISFSKFENYKGNKPVFVINYDTINNNNFYFFQCSTEDKVKQFAKFLGKIDSLKIIIVSTNYDDKNTKNAFINSLKFNIVPTSYYEVINYSEKGEEGLKKALSRSLINVIFIPSQSQVFIVQLMNTLNLLTKAYKISLCYLPEWVSFEKNLDIEQLFNLNTIKFDNFCIDFSDPKVNNFIQTYTSIFKKNPSINAFIGYDIARFLCEGIYKFDKNFTFCTDMLETNNTLSSSIYFESNYNIGIIISFYNYETKSLKPLYYFRNINKVSRINFPEIKIRK